MHGGRECSDLKVIVEHDRRWRSQQGIATTLSLFDSSRDDPCSQEIREGSGDSRFVAGGCRELRARLVRGWSFLRGDAGLDDEDSPRMSSSALVVGMVAVWGCRCIEREMGMGRREDEDPSP